MRNIYLISLADRILFYWEKWKLSRKNFHYLKENPDFIPPPSHLSFDAYNQIDYEWYHNTGKSNAQVIKDIAKKHLVLKEINVLEWGCGPARILRHLASFNEFKDSQIYGSDYNKETINWCKRNYSNIKFESNDLSPPLPFRRNFFTLVYAFSVFTHLSEEMHHNWLHEILRVLRPGGVFIFTTHGNAYKEDLFENERKSYESGKLVVRGKVTEGKKSFGAYHPEKFIKIFLSDSFDILDHLTVNTGIRQDVWVARKI